MPGAVFGRVAGEDRAAEVMLPAWMSVMFPPTEMLPPVIAPVTFKFFIAGLPTGTPCR